MASKVVKGKYFEDFVVGEEYMTPSRTVTVADILNFAGLSGDWAQLHTSIEFAKSSLFGERIAMGGVTITLAEGLLNRLNLWDDTFMGVLDRSWSFRVPVRLDDTLTVKLKIIDKEESEKYPNCGCVKRQIVITNQKDETISEGEGRILVLRKIGHNEEGGKGRG